MSEFDIICDKSKQNLKEVPPETLQMPNLKMLYLQQNFIKELPADFFTILTNLTWLDLRNNHLTAIPRNIAHHPNLENFLLSDNKLEALPDELGLVPKLKVLQVANNPLSYPHVEVVIQGTKGIVAFLRQKCERSRVSSKKSEEYLKDPEKEMRIEKEIKVVAEYSKDNYPSQQSITEPSLTVKGLSTIKRNDGIVHKVSSTSPNKISIRSYYDDDEKSTQTGESISSFPPLQQTCVDKLKELLEQQERILQQERLDGLKKQLKSIKLGIYRNLQALTTWRTKKKPQLTLVSGDDYHMAPPYATDPNYGKILSRDDLYREIERMTQFDKQPPKAQNIEKLIADLVSQLKDMDTNSGGLESARSELEAAGAQIMKVLLKVFIIEVCLSMMKPKRFEIDFNIKHRKELYNIFSHSLDIYNKTN